MAEESYKYFEEGALLFTALKPVSVPINEIAFLNSSNISEVWLFIEKYTGNKVLIRDTEKEIPSFLINGEDERKKILENSPSEVWKILFLNTDIASEILSEKEFSLRKKFLSLEYVKFSPLSDKENNDPFSVKALVVTLYLKSFPVLSPEIQENALKIAISHGDTHSQAMLYSCVDLKMLSEDAEDKMFDYFSRAKEAAELQEDLTLTIHVMFSLSSKMSMRGRLKEFISYSEELVRKIVPRIETTDMEKADFHLKKMIEGFRIYNTLISLNYYLAGNYVKSLSILHGLLEKIDRNKNHRFYESVRSYLANIYADQRMTEKAEYYSENLYEYWTSNPNEGAFSWMTCITLASIAMQKNDIRSVRKYLEKGHFYRMKSGFYHHYGNILLDVLEWYEIKKGKPVKGITLDSELKRFFDWPDINMCGVARRFSARKLIRKKADMNKVISELNLSIELLEKAGAYPALIESIDMLLELEDHLQDSRTADDLRLLKENVSGYITGVVRKDGAVDRTEFIRKKIYGLIYDIGSLSEITEKSGNPWENVLNLIQSGTGCESCGIFEMDSNGNDVIRIQAIHSVSDEWSLMVRKFLMSDGFSQIVDNSYGFKQSGFYNEDRLIIVPFMKKGGTERYFLCMENSYTIPLITKDNSELLGIIGLQLSVLAENIYLWEEIQTRKLSLENENLYFRKRNPAVSDCEIIGNSNSVVKMRELIYKIAPLDSTVLITGETGTGKELVAREIYQNSARSDGPFIAVNVAATPGELLYSTLFGHEKGAFTGAVKQSKGLFEMADGGTIFLDEIGDMGINDQVHLLRVLQERTFKRIGSEKQISSDFRLIAATNRNLLEDVRNGRFREDLYYRLNVFPINVPPLKERKEDIPDLVSYFMKQFSRTMGKSFGNIDRKSLESLMYYDWPGNIRELRHVIERSCIISEEPFLKVEMFQNNGIQRDGNVRDTLDQIIRKSIIRALKVCQGRIRGKDGAAAMLGINPSTLYSKIGKLGIKDEIEKTRKR